MKRARIYTLTWILSLLLLGCADQASENLQAELDAMSSGLRAQIDPLPQLIEPAPLNYLAAELPDPFRAQRVETAARSRGAHTGTAPDLSRPREPLEAFALDQLQVVGILQQRSDYSALIRAGTVVYRLRVGQRLGQNHGRITAVDTQGVDIKELVQDAAGDWTERRGRLSVQGGG